MNVIDGLARDELSLVADLLADAALEFADHGSNDLLLPATDENKAICVAVISHHGRRGVDRLSIKETLASTGKAFVYDDWAMQYFVHRCKERLGDPQAGRPLSPAELKVIGTLLESAAQSHEESAGEVCHDLTFPASAATKALMAGVIKQNMALAKRSDNSKYKRVARKTAAAAAGVIEESVDEKGELDIPDFWLMRYLAKRCRQVSRAVRRG
jgi:hypothetical protein